MEQEQETTKDRKEGENDEKKILILKNILMNIEKGLH